MVFAEAGVPTEWSFSVLSEQGFNVGGEPRTLEYVRASADQDNSYLLYIPSSNPMAPVIILNEPYDGISWTGEGVDQGFAELGPGKHPDSFAPTYNGRDLVRFTPETMAPDGGSLKASVDLWLKSGFAIIKTYGRFYAGGSLINDISDAVAPWYFIADRASTFQGRQVFTTGGSWGGMMALYGAAAAPESLESTAIAVSSPPWDIQSVRAYGLQLESDSPAVSSEINAFFSPFIRRIDASITPGDTRPVPFDTATLCQCMPARVLVAHDDHDTIVPVEQTEALQASCGERVQPVFWRRADQPDVKATGLSHGDFGGRSTATDVSTLLSAWIIAQADVSPTIIPADPASISGFLAMVSEARQRGENISFAVAALKPLISEKIKLQSTAASVGAQPGAEFLANIVQTLFGGNVTATSVREALTADQLPF